MKRLSIVLLAVLCIFMVSCNKNDNANNSAVSVDRTEPNTSSPETTASPETSSPETTKSPETTPPPVPVTTVPNNTSDEPTPTPTYGIIDDCKRQIFSYPYPVSIGHSGGGMIFKTRSELVSFIESKEYLEKIRIKYSRLDPDFRVIDDAEKEQRKQQIYEDFSKLLDLYDEDFFEDTWIVLTYGNIPYCNEIDQVVDVYRGEKGFEVHYFDHITIPKEEMPGFEPGMYHLVGAVLEIPKEYLIEIPIDYFSKTPKIFFSEFFVPSYLFNTLYEFGVDSKEAAELAEDERAIDLFKKYKIYRSNGYKYSENVQKIDEFLEKYQK